MEWRNAVYPKPTSQDGSSSVPAQTTTNKSLTRQSFVPKLLDAAGVAIPVATWLADYSESHCGWNINMVRKAPDDGLLSFAALVHSESNAPQIPESSVFGGLRRLCHINQLHVT